jgi:Tfp pilus assembly protein PilO
MSDEELKQLIESNARATQAMLDNMAEARLERQELREGMVQLQNSAVELQNAVVQLINVQSGIANLLTSLDEDRPTVLRKLTAIENKLDRLLEQENAH